MNIRRVAGVLFRLYLGVLVVGLLVLLVWLGGGLNGLAEEVAVFWFAIAAVGAVTVAVMLAAFVWDKTTDGEDQPFVNASPSQDTADSVTADGDARIGHNQRLDRQSAGDDGSVETDA